MAERKRLLTRLEKILLILALLVILYFLLDRAGVRIGKVTDETEIVDPYRGQ